MHQRFRPLANAIGAVLLLAGFGAATVAAEDEGNALRHGSAEPAAWQGPSLAAQLVPPPGRDAAAPPSATPNVDQPKPNPATTPAPPEIVTPSSTPKQYDTPLLDGKLPSEELMPPVVAESGEGGCVDGARQGVQPYGGGHPTDWSWGCGGNPYRTGPGLCDNYKVGPRWHVTFDGMVMHRESTDLAALQTAMPGSFPTVPFDQNGTAFPPVIPGFEQFNYGPGGRIAFMSQVGRCTNYDVQVAYEGINDWDASIVYPVQSITVAALQPNGPAQFIITPDPNTEPNDPFPEGVQQRSLHYRSNMNSLELNFLPYHGSAWRPTFGARFIRFDDEISDSLNQEVQGPLPGPSTTIVDPGGENIAVNDPIGPSWETDRLNLFHLENNLMGFQVGLLHDTINLSDRFAIEGFVNGGVYYNKVKYSNVRVVSTNQTFADNTRTIDFDESRTDVSTIVNNDARDLDEISYQAEASLTGVCRLNRCWALRAGYQVLWINHLHMADAAYLGNVEGSQDLLFHGWHAGLECRR